MSVGVGSIGVLALGEGYRAGAVDPGLVQLDFGLVGVVGVDIVGDVEIIGDFQWTEGSVTLAQDTATVTGVGTRWQGQIDPGHLFICRQASSPQNMVAFQVLSVAGNESLTLSAPWPVATLAGAPYLIHRRLDDHGIPLLARDDQAFAALYSYAMIHLDQIIAETA